ncbi:MAG: hypothetical protein HQ522_06540 [Bacteroidetes bacterium]|nr:hypothetical protein [Bacteroidota bacterium]
MKTQIWATFLDVKFKAYLISILVNKYQTWDRNLNIFLALAASSSVASWVLWQEFEFLWSSIIVTSQVIHVVKPYLQYFKYVKELNSRSQKLDLITIEFEELWYKFNNKKIEEPEGVKQFFRLKKKTSELLNFGDDILFSARKKDKRKANERMKVFLKNIYNIEININPKIS